MAPLTKPTIMLPVSYVLPGTHRLWCKLKDVADVAPGHALLAETNIRLTPEQLVSRFAALARPNRFATPGSAKDEPKKKMFRYSPDGIHLHSKEVPVGITDAPPYANFFLDTELPYGEDMFVLADWATDVLYAIRKGAVAAADSGTMRFGFAPRGSARGLIYFDGNRAPVITKVPEFLK